MNTQERIEKLEKELQELKDSLKKKNEEVLNYREDVIELVKLVCTNGLID